MENTPRTSSTTRRLKGWHLSKRLSAFPKNTPKYLLMKELESYCGTIDDTIYVYVEDYHPFSGIFSIASMDNTVL